MLITHEKCPPAVAKTDLSLLLVMHYRFFWNPKIASQVTTFQTQTFYSWYMPSGAGVVVVLLEVVTWARSQSFVSLLNSYPVKKPTAPIPTHRQDGKKWKAARSPEVIFIWVVTWTQTWQIWMLIYHTVLLSYVAGKKRRKPQHEHSARFSIRFPFQLQPVENGFRLVFYIYSMGSPRMLTDIWFWASCRSSCVRKMRWAPSALPLDNSHRVPAKLPHFRSSPSISWQSKQVSSCAGSSVSVSYPK